uniref:Methanethiol oxidase n=1 Tax=Syphacia muris TaxID=451379 RepID=A0A0N5A825_9BILA
MKTCHCYQKGPGYASPTDAFLNGPREKYLFVVCANCDPTKPDRIVTVDVDPESKTYCSVVSQVVLPYIGDEVHHTGWNACSSCYNDSAVTRKYLVVPCLNSSRIYFVDTTDPKGLQLKKIVEPEIMLKNNFSFPHTSHCLGDGNIMISTLGDVNGDGKGDFVLFNGRTFELVGSWPVASSRKPKFNYDFWYQPRQNVMISTEWGSPKHFMHGLDASDLQKDNVYGRKIHIWDWNQRKMIQTVELNSQDGLLPFEIRFLHNPESDEGYFGTAIGSALYHFNKSKVSGTFKVQKVVSIPSKPAKDWFLPELPAIVSDIVISMDDKYLYASCWLHGEIHQYDITNSCSPKLVGKHQEKERVRELKGKSIDGGPQMLQLSLDGKRLYVTTSLYRAWDQQFYPNLLKNGSKMLQIECNTETGGLSLNENFIINFGEIEDGPFLAHEMRYPGGDCTSDIWV